MARADKPVLKSGNAAPSMERKKSLPASTEAAYLG